MNRIRNYVRIQPRRLIFSPPEDVYNMHFWNIMKSMKHSIKHKNQCYYSNITYIKTPYYYKYNGSYTDVSNLLNSLGKKSCILDKYKRTHMVQHLWYIDSNMQNTYKNVKDALIVNRTWFYQDYDTYNTPYPTKLFHCINVYPDCHQTESSYDYLEELSDEIWFPVIQDYLEPKSEFCVRIRE